MKIDPKNCTGSSSPDRGHSQSEYENIGFSPCGKYVAHRSNRLCDVSNVVVEVSTEPHNCQCRTDYCPCGEFLSHKISEPCTAQI